jgi:biofilm PGA synthesis lipoprotein PgaB
MTSRTILILLVSFFAHMALAEPDVPTHAVILQYHHVSATAPAITSIHPDKFQAHLDYLQQQKFTIWSLDRIINAIIQREQIPDKTVAITFDDAYLSVYTVARPLLKALNWPYTIFVSSDLIETNHRLYMSWSQLREIQAEGVLIANHTMSHTHLLRQTADESKQAWRDRIVGEIQGARSRIKQETGTDSNLFAYPYGEYDEAVKSMVKDLDIIAFGQHSGPLGFHSDLQALPRFPASGVYSDLKSLKLKLNTLPFPVHGPLPNPLLNTEDVRPILEVELEPGDYLIDQLACYTSHQGRNDSLVRLKSGFQTQANTALTVGRTRYNCTMPAKKMPTQDGRRYYWFSQPWIRLNPDGSWYPET